MRNRLYDCGVIKSARFDIPIISVGNITVGGTGKTPHVEYLASLLKDSYDIAVLSRGYGRVTRGFIKADALSPDSRKIGDEPAQIQSHFPDITVVADEDRRHGISTLTECCSKLDAIILDDAFQHRRVSPSLNMLLVDFNRNILDDMLLPAGRMRESAGGRRRADIIVVTKCPNGLSAEQMDALTVRLRCRKNQHVFFTTFAYGAIRPMYPECDCTIGGDTKVLALTGIAQPSHLIDRLKTVASDIGTMSFPDHHRYSRHDLERIAKTADTNGDSLIITTEKDEARLRQLDISDFLKRKLAVLPVKVVFLRNGNEFDKLVTEHIESFHKNSI